MGIFGGAPKQDVAGEQARLKASQDAAARSERDKMAASQAAKENQQAASAATMSEQSARANFAAGVVQDTEESRRKFLKKV